MEKFFLTCVKCCQLFFNTQPVLSTGVSNSVRHFYTRFTKLEIFDDIFLLLFQDINNMLFRIAVLPLKSLNTCHESFGHDAMNRLLFPNSCEFRKLFSFQSHIARIRNPVVSKSTDHSRLIIFSWGRY